MKKALMVTDDRLGNMVHNLKSTTPRTDADGLDRLTNEQIDAMFPESMVERYYTQRQAARQVRDLLQGRNSV
jgi:hypothetical protein